MNKLWYAVILCKTNILLLVASVTQDVGSGRRMLHSDYLEVTPPVAMETARLSSQTATGHQKVKRNLRKVLL